MPELGDPEEPAVELADVPDVRPLYRALEQWHRKLPVHLVRALRARLKDTDGFISVGTACSGTDIAVMLLEWMFDFWNEAYGVRLRMRQRFATEKNADVQRFLLQQFPDCEALIPDVEHLGSKWAPTIGLEHINTKETGRLIIMPGVHIYIAGFVCRARSRLNGKSHQNKGCVEAGTASTGRSFKAVIDYVVKHRPRAVVLENLETLLETAEDGSCDGDYIIRFLQDLGYKARAFCIDARLYGSVPRRDRVFWVALITDDPTRMDLLASIIEATRIGTVGTIFDYLLDDSCRQVSNTSPSGTDPDKDYLFKDEHMRLFDCLGLAWPPARGILESLDHLDQRPYEVSIYVHTAFPHKPELDTQKPVRVEYFDVNQTLGRLCGPEGEQNPWTTTFPTLTGSGQYVMRYAEDIHFGSGCFDDPEFSLVYRHVDGLELLQLIGWPMDEIRGDFPSHSVGSSMAGNAFSGFAVGPVLMGVMACIDLRAPDVSAEQEVQSCEEGPESDDCLTD